MSRSHVRVLFLTLGLAACGGGGATTDGTMSDAGTMPGVDGGPPGTDAGPAPSLRTLVSGDWSLAMGEEAYKCIRLTMDHDVYIHRFHPVIPMGTHHTVLSVGSIDGPHPDGTTDCTGFANGPYMLFGSGVGTGDFELPPGIAVKVSAGDQITLNLHLFNITAPSGLNGTSAIQIEEMNPADVTDLAETYLAGISSGLVVPGHMTSTQTGMCPVATGHMFALFPHMHQTGIHQTVTLMHHDGSADVVLDTDYTFDMQQYHLLTPQVDLSAGDMIKVDCTYDNPGATKYYGEHTYDEMCYAGIYRWPAVGSLLTCAF